MRPELFQIFDQSLHTYGAMLAASMFACYFLLRQLFRGEGIRLKDTQVMDMCVIAVLSGVVGSRVLYILQNTGAFRSILDLFKVWEGGLSFHGGLFGGTVAVVIYLRRKGIPILKAGDSILPCVLLGLAWGRIGCFMNGCCFGTVCSLPWAVQFPPGSPAFMKHAGLGLIAEDAAASLPVHPAQVYSTLAAVLTVALLLWLNRRLKTDGLVLALSLTIYGVVRFLIEFLRDDDDLLASGLTQSQYLSVAVFAAGVFLLAILLVRQRSPQDSPPED